MMKPTLPEYGVLDCLLNNLLNFTVMVYSFIFRCFICLFWCIILFWVKTMKPTLPEHGVLACLFEYDLLELNFTVMVYSFHCRWFICPFWCIILIYIKENWVKTLALPQFGVLDCLLNEDYSSWILQLLYIHFF